MIRWFYFNQTFLKHFLVSSRFTQEFFIEICSVAEKSNQQFSGISVKICKSRPKAETWSISSTLLKTQLFHHVSVQLVYDYHVAVDKTQIFHSANSSFYPNRLFIIALICRMKTNFDLHRKMFLENFIHFNKSCWRHGHWD